MLSKVYQAVFSLLLIPVYLKFLGIESYALIGVFMTLISIFQIMDFGISATVMRETARLSVNKKHSYEMRSLIYTLQFPYWLIGILVGLLIIAISEFLSTSWLNSSSLNQEIIQTSIAIMGLIFILRWPISFYSGGLQGLQKHVYLSCVNITEVTLRGVGSVVVLLFVSDTIVAFFYWQLVSSFIHVLICALILWNNLPKASQKSKFDFNLIKKHFNFAMGMTGFAITTAIHNQIDNIVLTKFLSLEIFGYYALAKVVGNSLYYIIGPVNTSIYPRITQLVSLSNINQLKGFYHYSCKLMSILIIPVGTFISFFSYEIMLYWTGDLLIANESYLLLSLLIWVYIFNGLMHLPFSMILAYGWVSTPLLIELIQFIIMTPIIILCASQYGVISMIIAMVAINFFSILIFIPVIHTRFLKGEALKWFIKDVGFPMLSSICIVLIFRYLFVPMSENLYNILMLFFLIIFLYLVMVFINKPIRDQILSIFSAYFKTN